MMGRTLSSEARGLFGRSPSGTHTVCTWNPESGHVSIPTA